MDLRLIVNVSGVLFHQTSTAVRLKLITPRCPGHACLASTIPSHMSFCTLATGPSYSFLARTKYNTVAIIMSPTNRTQAQFMFVGVTSYAFGQKLQKNAHMLYKTAAMLTGMPNRPRLHLAGGRGSFRMRFSITQPRLMQYVAMRADALSDNIALNAAVEPMLMQAMTMVNIHVTIAQSASA